MANNTCTSAVAVEPKMQLVEVWLRRDFLGTNGKPTFEEFRIFGSRPQSIPEGYMGERFRTTLQPVRDGIVEAWKPVWEDWLTHEEIEAKALDLIKRGMTVVRGEDARQPLWARLMRQKMVAAERRGRLRDQQFQETALIEDPGSAEPNPARLESSDGQATAA